MTLTTKVNIDTSLLAEADVGTDLRGKPWGEVVAENVSEADYMEYYAASYHEHVRGYVIKKSPASFRHNNLTDHLQYMLEAYFSFNPIGITISSPFVMRLSNIDSRREPDLQVIVNEHADRIKATYTDGPADICIEVVSPSNASTDYGEKLVEYEACGVREYWMFDQERQIAYFYRLNDQGVYTNIPLDKQGEYQTPLLPGFRLTIATLWQEKLPTLLEVIEQVRASLNLTDDAQGTS